jgi:hypothetical protein
MAKRTARRLSGRRRGIRREERPEDALQQLHWCIGYPHGIRKVGISRALAANHSYVREELMQRSPQPVTTGSTEAWRPLTDFSRGLASPGASLGTSSGGTLGFGDPPVEQNASKCSWR